MPDERRVVNQGVAPIIAGRLSVFDTTGVRLTCGLTRPDKTVRVSGAVVKMFGEKTGRNGKGTA